MSFGLSFATTMLLFAPASRPAVGGTHPTVQWLNEAQGEKQTNRAGDYLPFCSAKNTWTYTAPIY
jgi:hypothetical protein